MYLGIHPDHSGGGNGPSSLQTLQAEAIPCKGQAWEWSFDVELLDGVPWCSGKDVFSPTYVNGLSASLPGTD